ncbi:YsnF/AvaK domain-containing protein [Fibrella forsythiae]|uniref:YsnF/AvaK domain-containing protein n=1 Tax=Fibrella forsythiae TaxID=2817061 RepID=A0ABS3JT61_9BACT|nr:YsnF/AvaK domain-containing protein [Fibrella forsythiae]MBO0953210.1 YsnF/AvaK domain-containing protein [Fibrella forsythiae]
MALTVIGVFDNASQAQSALEQLVSAGFARTSVDVSTTTNLGSDSTLTGDTHQNTTGTRTDEFLDEAKDTGSSIGSFFSSLFGDDSQDDRDKYTRVAAKGSIVTVHAQSEEEAGKAADILDEAGAVDIDEKDVEYGYGSAPASGVLTDTTSTDQPLEGDQTLKVIEENLQVGKRTVETGGVRVRSRIIAKPVEEHVRLREERVTVQRNPVNRPATSADLDAFQEGQIELTQHAEVPVVAKTAQVVEEISIGKAVSEREEVIRDTVRSTEVDVENLTATDQPRQSTQTGLDDEEVTYSTQK